MGIRTLGTNIASGCGYALVQQQMDKLKASILEKGTKSLLGSYEVPECTKQLLRGDGRLVVIVRRDGRLERILPHDLATPRFSC